MRLLTVVVLLSLSLTGEAIRCYECASSDDPKGEDLCGAYKSFDESRHTPVECNSEESHTRGTFCMKIVQQGPKGFIWDGRWRQVIRRCAAVATSGVTGVCNWGVYETGVYWEECFCDQDGCNGSSLTTIAPYLLFLTVSALKFFNYFIL